MSEVGRRGWLPSAMLAGVLVCLPGCSGAKPEPEFGVGGLGVVRGKVTYKGQPVPYGIVLFYNDRSLNPGNGMLAPVAQGLIDQDGGYMVLGAPEGVVQIVVGTSPDVELQSLTYPILPGGGDPGPFSPPQIGPPMPPQGTPAWALTEEQKKQLREIHGKYGEYWKGGLSYKVVAGEQIHDLVLK